MTDVLGGLLFIWTQCIMIPYSMHRRIPHLLTQVYYVDIYEIL